MQNVTFLSQLLDRICKNPFILFYFNTLTTNQDYCLWIVQWLKKKKKKRKKASNFKRFKLTQTQSWLTRIICSSDHVDLIFLINPSRTEKKVTAFCFISNIFIYLSPTFIKVDMNSHQKIKRWVKIRLLCLYSEL